MIASMLALIVLATIVAASLATIVAASLATAMCHWRTEWFITRTAFFASSPLPGILAIYCFWMLIEAAVSSPSECGADSCGMAAMIAMIGIGYAVVAFLVGLIAAGLTKRLLGK